MTTKKNAPVAVAAARGAEKNSVLSIIANSGVWRQCDACGYRFSPLRAWQILCGVCCGWPEGVSAAIVLVVGVLQ